METKIIKEKKNPFLERTEFELEIKNITAPTFDEVKAELGKDAELTIVKKVNTSFGKQVFKVEAVVYDSMEAKDKVETIPQKVRKKMAEEAKKAEEEAKKAAAEAKKAEEEAKAAEAEAPAEEPAAEATPEVEAPKEETKEETPVVEPAAAEKTE
jgi:ribosomal protein S24E